MNALWFCKCRDNSFFFRKKKIIWIWFLWNGFKKITIPVYLKLFFKTTSNFRFLLRHNMKKFRLTERKCQREKKINKRDYLDNLPSSHFKTRAEKKVFSCTSTRYKCNPSINDKITVQNSSTSAIQKGLTNIRRKNEASKLNTRTLKSKT